MWEPSEVMKDNIIEIRKPAVSHVSIKKCRSGVGSSFIKKMVKNYFFPSIRQNNTCKNKNYLCHVGKKPDADNYFEDENFISNNGLENALKSLNNVPSKDVNLNVSENMLSSSCVSSENKVIQCNNYRYNFLRNILMIKEDNLTSPEIHKIFLKLLQEFIVQTKYIQEIYNLFILNNMELRINDTLGSSKEPKNYKGVTLNNPESIISCFKYLVVNYNSCQNKNNDSIYLSNEKLQEYNKKLDEWHTWKMKHWNNFKNTLKTNYDIFVNNNEDIVFYSILMSLAEWQFRAKVLYLVTVAYELYAQLLKEDKRSFYKTIKLVALYLQQLIVLREKCMENRKNLIKIIACFLLFNKKESVEWSKINEALAIFNVLDEEMKLDEVLNQPLEKLITRAEIRWRKMAHALRLGKIERTDSYRNKIVKGCMLNDSISTCILNIQSNAVNYSITLFKITNEIIDFLLLRKFVSISYFDGNYSGNFDDAHKTIKQKNHIDYFNQKTNENYNNSYVDKLLDNSILNKEDTELQNKGNNDCNIYFNLADDENFSSTEEEDTNKTEKNEIKKEETFCWRARSNRSEKSDYKAFYEAEKRKIKTTKDFNKNNEKFLSDSQEFETADTNYFNREETIISLVSTKEIDRTNTSIAERAFTRYIESFHQNLVKQKCIESEEGIFYNMKSMDIGGIDCSTYGLGSRNFDIMESYKYDSIEETNSTSSNDEKFCCVDLGEAHDSCCYNKKNNYSHKFENYINLEEYNDYRKIVENIFNTDSFAHSFDYPKSVSNRCSDEIAN